MKTKFLFLFLLWPMLIFGQERLKISKTTDFSAPQDSIFTELDKIFPDYDTMEITTYGATIEKRSKTIRQAKEYYRDIVKTAIESTGSVIISLDQEEDLVTFYFKPGIITAYRNRRDVVLSYLDDYGLNLIINQNP